MIKGYKVTNSKMQCRDFQYELNKLYKHDGRISLCNEGFHFCKIPQHCFNYYSFTTENRVFEIQTSGNVIDGDDKSVTDQITFIKEIPWDEVLKIVNTGANNTGHSNSGNRNSDNWNSGNRNSGSWNSGDRNSGNRNSGNRNSGNWNSGNRNSGNWNSGNWNSGNRNSGDSNSGYRNSGNWNSGNRNSGDSNSGYRNSGAFCTDNNPNLILFNKPTKIKIIEWEKHRAVELMCNIDTTIWVPESIMTYSEKKENPQYKTTEGYLKTITLKEAWSNFWYNLKDSEKNIFLTLPNFDAKIFEEITGIKTN